MDSEYTITNVATLIYWIFLSFVRRRKLDSSSDVDSDIIFGCNLKSSLHKYNFHYSASWSRASWSHRYYCSNVILLAIFLSLFHWTCREKLDSDSNNIFGCDFESSLHEYNFHHIRCLLNVSLIMQRRYFAGYFSVFSNLTLQIGIWVAPFILQLSLLNKASKSLS